MIVAKREEKDGLDFFTIYDKEGNPLSQSQGKADSNSDDNTIYHSYDDLDYICKKDGEIFISLDSLNNKFSKP